MVSVVALWDFEADFAHSAKERRVKVRDVVGMILLLPFSNTLKYGWGLIQWEYVYVRKWSLREPR
jgi:hypothetical protein